MADSFQLIGEWIEAAEHPPLNVGVRGNVALQHGFDLARRPDQYATFFMGGVA